MRIIPALCILLVCIAITCGCTVSTSPGSVPPAGTAAAPSAAEPVGSGVTKIVSLKASSYNPEQLYVKAGTTVIWVNEENRLSRRVVHMPTDATGPILFQSESLSPGESYQYTFTKPGRYVYADPQHGGGRSPFIEVTA